MLKISLKQGQYVNIGDNIAQSSGNRQGTTRDALFVINNAGKGSPVKKHNSSSKG